MLGVFPQQEKRHEGPLGKRWGWGGCEQYPEPPHPNLLSPNAGRSSSASKSLPSRCPLRRILCICN